MTVVRHYAPFVLLLVVVPACTSAPVAPVRDAGVNRVFATVRGIT